MRFIQIFHNILIICCFLFYITIVLALNCNNSLAAYDTIIACGIADAKTTTISEQVGFEVTPAMAADVIKLKLGQIAKVTL